MASRLGFCKLAMEKRAASHRPEHAKNKRSSFAKKKIELAKVESFDYLCKNLCKDTYESYKP